jgi:hypothetical protein
MVERSSGRLNQALPASSIPPPSEEVAQQVFDRTAAAPKAGVVALQPPQEGNSVMQKRKFTRTAALATTVVATAALLSGVVATTGAYFSANTTGAVAGNLATVAVTTVGSGGSDANNLTFTWANMLPGEDKVASIHVQNTGNVSEDIYLVFKNDNLAWSGINTLGQYGKFVIDGKTFDNLNNHYQALTPGQPGTPNGNGPTGPCGQQQIGANYLPHVIFLGTLGPTASKDFTMAFQFNPCMADHQGEAFGPLGFQIGAFQVGILPSDPYNQGGQIPDLTLPNGWYQ